MADGALGGGLPTSRSVRRAAARASAAAFPRGSRSALYFLSRLLTLFCALALSLESWS